MERELAGRTALVTGGAKGIGRAVCLQLARAGANVAVNYRGSQKAAEETLAAVREAGADGLVVQADVSQPEEVERLVAEVEQALGPVDVLVNNAGVFEYVPHEETTFDSWKRMLDNNLTSAFLTTWAVKDGMIERGFGRIVNVTSVAGLRPRPRCIPYAVSKAGLVSLTKSTAEAFGPHDVRVNAVAPGLIETEMVHEIADDRLAAGIAATPLRRIGTPEDVAELVMFLVSERSSFVTGQTYVASGGRVTLP